jgi:hypothetical protein
MQVRSISTGGVIFMSEYTKGPWEVDAGDDPCVRDRDSAVIIAVRHRITKAEWRECARVISAAPELLDALKATRHLLKAFVGEGDQLGMTHITMADKAIAKAEGK